MVKRIPLTYPEQAIVRYCGAAVNERNIPSLPFLVNWKINSYSLGLFKLSPRDSRIMNIRILGIFIPKNRAMGEKVFSIAPSTIYV